MKNLILISLLIPLISFGQTKKELKVIDKAATKISVKKDKFNGTTTWSSPSFGSGIAATTAKRVKFIKVLDGVNTTTYLSLTTYGATLNIGEKGLILLFQDGTKLEKPNAEVDSKSDSGTVYWEYSTFTRISDEELEMFASKKIDSFRLYIYEGKPITKKSVLQVMGYARGILNSK